MGQRRPVATPKPGVRLPLRHRNIVDRDITDRAPAAAHQVGRQPGHVRQPQPGVAQCRPVPRAQEPPPIVRADRQQPQHVLGAELGRQEGRGVRFSVDRNSSPPGSSSPARMRTKAAGSGTCSITSSAVTTGKRMPSASRSSAAPHAIGQRAGPGPSACARAAAIASPAASMPSTSKPRRASASAASPAPQPTSSTARRGCRKPPRDTRRRSSRSAPGSSGAAAASARAGPTSAPPARRICATSAAETVAATHGCCPSCRAPVCVRPTTRNAGNRSPINGPHRDEIRRHLRRRPRPHPQRRRRASSARSTPATRSPSWSPPWPAPPTSSSPGARRCRRCTTRANTTPWSPPASRSPPACWRSRCRSSASRRAPGRAGRSRSSTDNAHGKARIHRHRRRRT